MIQVVRRPVEWECFIPFVTPRQVGEAARVSGMHNEPEALARAAAETFLANASGWCVLGTHRRAAQQKRLLHPDDSGCGSLLLAKKTFGRLRRTRSLREKRGSGVLLHLPFVILANAIIDPSAELRPKVFVSHVF